MRRFLRLMPATANYRYDRTERGETYVELLIAAVIIGLASVAIIGALLTTISGSTIHRYLATDDTVAKSALESVKYQVQLKPLASEDFLDCSASTTPQQILTIWVTSGSGHTVTLPTPPSGYTTRITGLECWSITGGVGSFDANCSVVAGVATTSDCGTKDSYGLQRVTVSVIDPGGHTANLSTLVRNPVYKVSYYGQY